MLEKFVQDYKHGASTPDAGRLNLALMSSMRQLIKTEGIGKVSIAVRRQLTGTAEYLASSLTNKRNPLSSTYNLVLIVTDDFKKYKGEENYVTPYPAGRPWDKSTYTVVRDFKGNVVSTPTLDSLVYNLPSTWRAIERENRDKRIEGKILWEEELMRCLDDKKVDVLLLDGLMVRLGAGIVPEDRGISPAYKGRILSSYTGLSPDVGGLPSSRSFLVAAGREDIRGLVIRDPELIRNSHYETNDSSQYRVYSFSKNPLVAAGLYGFALLPETGRLVRENRERISGLSI